MSILNYFNHKNFYGISRKDQLLKLIKSTKISFFKNKIDKNNIFNIFFIIDDLQGDIDIHFIICILGRSIKFTWYCFVDWWKDNRKPYILYWKFIGKRYWEK